MNTAKIKRDFLLDPQVTFLNFGSFGACPKPVFEDYQIWQRELEYEPVQFIAVNGPGYLKTSRDALGKYVGCSGDDLVYVTNPSYAVNIVAKNLGLKKGDEILSTNIEYGACDRALNYYCRQAGAKYVRQPIRLPIKDKNEFVTNFFEGLTERTKAIFISHITSTTGLILPVKEICERAKEKGLITIVDGAHVPGHIPLNIAEIKADIYTGACHKWMLTAKGCSFLYIKKELQNQFDPLVVSWGYESVAPSHSQFLDYHQMQGTRDFSAFLTVPRAIEYMRENNWEQVAATCRKLVRDNAQRFCELAGSDPLAPLTDEFIGQMFSIPILTVAPELLQQQLFNQYKIEIPVMRQDDKVFLRYSINAFNSQEDLDKLYNALKEIKAEGKLFSRFPKKEQAV